MQKQLSDLQFYVDDYFLHPYNTTMGTQAVIPPNPSPLECHKNVVAGSEVSFDVSLPLPGAITRVQVHAPS